MGILSTPAGCNLMVCMIFTSMTSETVRLAFDNNNLFIYIYIYDSQIVHHNPCFNLLILHNNSFASQGSEINKNGIFLRFDKLSFFI